MKNIMNKNIIILVLTLAAVTVVVGCVQKIKNEDSIIKNQKQNQNEKYQNQQIEIGPEILETDIGTNDWAEYKSDKYGYIIKLPKEFIFIDEYYGEEIEYSPNESFFILVDINDKNNYENRIGFSVRQRKISDLINNYKNESKDEIKKLFSHDNIDYYDKTMNNNFPFPTILHRNSLIMEIGCGNGVGLDLCREIVSTVKLFNNHSSGFEL